MSQDLKSLNSATLGADFPEITLPDGSKVQTGTINALLTNIKTYNTLKQSQPNIPPTKPGVRQSTKKQVESLEDSFRAAIPLLFRVGMFELFGPEEWISSSEGQNQNPGRKRVGELAGEWLGQQEKERARGD